MPVMRDLPGGSIHPQEQCEREQADPESEESQVNQLDQAHTTSGSVHRRGRHRIGQVRFGTVFVVVPAVVQSHPASVTHVAKVPDERSH